MKFSKIQEIVGKEPVFETGLLLAGDVVPNGVRRQLSRLVASGRLIQLRRGLYSLAPPFQKVSPHPFVAANSILRPSYVSLQSALAFYGMIPEHVPVVTSVTTSRTGRWENALGTFRYRYVKPGFFFGYRVTDLGEGQSAMVATPQKALLDLLYLEPGSDDPAYLEELRLENLDLIDLNDFKRTAAESGRPKLQRAADRLERIALVTAGEYETL